MAQIKLSLLFIIVLFALLPQAALAQGWHGIVPLKSTRAEVEHRFGKPNKWGDYEFKNERVSFNYGSGPCKSLYLPLAEDNCKCLADEDAVMSIFVEPSEKRKASGLRLNMAGFKKTPISPFPYTFQYENERDGIVYTVDEDADEIKHITYYPTKSDCQKIISQYAAKGRNIWRGLVPLQSNRKDVEALLGSPDADRQEKLVSYETEHENVVAKYSNGNCDSADSEWKVPKDTLIELIVNPNPNFLLKDLHLAPTRYQRREIFPYPELDNPPRVWNYTDASNGIEIRAEASRATGEEVVVSITYFAAERDGNRRCR